MEIEFVEISNFRKLKACRVDLAGRQTLFVGANNSGKTSAMDALIFFLKEKGKFTTREFTLSNWKEMNAIGEQWITTKEITTEDLSPEKWHPYVPTLDVWIKVETNEIHYVNHLIPTLDWAGGLLGVRLRFEPKSTEELFTEFSLAYNSAAGTTEAARKNKVDSKISLKLWPKSMWHFLDTKLHSHFQVKAYILDPAKIVAPLEGVIKPQLLIDAVPLDGLPFEGLIKVDIINAQRGFSDPNSDAAQRLTGNLSAQLRDYYSKHLNPSDQPDAADIEALQSIEEAKQSFDQRLQISFTDAFKELEELNYPGFGNPAISISSRVDVTEGLKHESAVQFKLLKEIGPTENPLTLPEKYNGLGYQNLISMVFQLIRYRDQWMLVKKSLKAAPELAEFEPLHLVLVEEPEAHLHAQVQQVFINKAYSVLRNHKNLGVNPKFRTQLVVSTHSSHIAHEVDFSSLRYFRRKKAETGGVPTSSVVNLSTTFGEGKETAKFSARYLKTTHCDLFFADAVILIEGPAERMLLPHFIKQHYPALTSCYISILEIGGSHAHKLRPLIEDLGIITLLLTDLDSIEPTGRTSVLPESGKGYVTNNYSLKNWLPCKEKVDDLMTITLDQKVSANSLVRVAYQYPLQVKNTKEEKTVTPYTFEDALVFQNLEMFRTLKGDGLIKKFNLAANKETISDAAAEMFKILSKNPKKAEFALELLFIEEPGKLCVPRYISEGLSWLETQLKSKQQLLSL